MCVACSLATLQAGKRWGKARWYVVDGDHFGTDVHRRGLASVRRMRNGELVAPDLSQLGGEEYCLSVAKGQGGEILTCVDGVSSSAVALVAAAAPVVPGVTRVSIDGDRPAAYPPVPRCVGCVRRAIGVPQRYHQCRSL